MWQCQSVTNLPPRCHSNDSPVHNKHTERGKKQMAQTTQAFASSHVSFAVIFRINNTLSHWLARAPITTALVAAIRRSKLSWLRAFESQTRHFLLFQHLIKKKNYCRRTRWVFKISHVEVSAALKWHEIIVYNYQHHRHSRVTGISGTQLCVISVAPAGVDMNHCRHLKCLLQLVHFPKQIKCSDWARSISRRQPLDHRMSTVKIEQINS